MIPLLDALDLDSGTTWSPEPEAEPDPRPEPEPEPLPPVVHLPLSPRPLIAARAASSILDYPVSWTR